MLPQIPETARDLLAVQIRRKPGKGWNQNSLFLIGQIHHKFNNRSHTMHTICFEASAIWALVSVARCMGNRGVQPDFCTWGLPLWRSGRQEFPRIPLWFETTN
jgi:hypothetical protein